MMMKQTEETANWGNVFDTVLEAVTHLGIFGANGASAVECARMATGIITESLQGKVVSRDLAAQVIQTSLRESQTKSKIQRVKESSPRLAGKVLAESVLGKLSTSRKELTSISHLSPMGDAYVPVAGLHPSLMENITKAVTRTLGELSGHYYDAERVRSLISAYDIDGSDGSHWLMEVVSRGPLPVNGYEVLLTNPRGLSFVVGGGTVNVGQHPYLNTPTLTEAVGKSEFNDQEYFNSSVEDLEEFRKPDLSGIKQRWQELTTPTKKEVKQRYKVLKTGMKTLKPKDVGVSRGKMKKNIKKEAEKQVRFAKKAHAVGTMAGEAARKVSTPVKLAGGAVGAALLLRAIKNRKKKRKRDEYGRYLESLEEAKQGQRYRGLKNVGGRPGYAMPIGQQATLDAMNSQPFVHTPPSVAKRPDKYFMADVDEPSNNLAERFPSQLLLHQQQMYNRNPEAMGNIPKSLKPIKKSTISSLTPNPAGLGYRLRDQLGAVAEDELDEYGDFPYPMDYGRPMGQYAAREIGDIEREPSKLQPGVKIPRALMDRYEQSAEKMIDNLEHQKRRKFTESERRAYKAKFINHMIRMRRLHYEDIIEACKTRGKKKNEAAESPEKLAGDVMTKASLEMHAGIKPKRNLRKFMRYGSALSKSSTRPKYGWGEDVDEATCPITGKEIPDKGQRGKGLGLRRFLLKGAGPVGESDQFQAEGSEQIDEAWPRRPKKTRTKKSRKHKMPHFLKQRRPKGVKRIYKALTRGGKPTAMKRRYGTDWKGVAARIASRQGPPGPQAQGPPYAAPLTGRRKRRNEEINEDFRSDYRQALQVQEAGKGQDEFVKNMAKVALKKGKAISPEKAAKTHQKFVKNIQQAKAGQDVREDNVTGEYSGNPNDLHRQGTGPVVSRSTTSDKQGKKGSRRGYMGEFRHDHPLHQVAFQGAPKANRIEELSPERKMLVSQGLAEQPDVGFVFPANATDQGANVPIRSYGLKRKKTINKMEAHGVNRIPLARLKDRLAPIDNPMTVAQVQGGGGTMERMQNMVLPTGGGKEAGQYVKLREGIFSKKKKKRKKADVIDVGGGMKLNLAQLTQGVQHQRIFNPMMMGEAAGEESQHVISRGSPGGYMTRYYAPETRPLGRMDKDDTDEVMRTIMRSSKRKKRRKAEESVADLRAVKRLVVDHVVSNSEFPKASVEEAVDSVLMNVDFSQLHGLQGSELTEAHRELSRSVIPYVHKVLSGETDELGEDQVKREVVSCVLTELMQEHQVPTSVAARALGRVFRGVELNIATEQDFHEAVDYLVEAASPEIENVLFEDANVTGRVSSNLMELLAKHGLSPEEALGFGRSRLLSLGFSPLDIIDLKRNFDWRGIKKPAPGGSGDE